MRSKRPTIALFLAEIEEDFSDLLRRGVVDGAELYDANLIMLPGKTLNSPYPYQYQYHVIYNMISQDNVDALILPSSVFTNYSSPEECERFYQSYLPLPIVTLCLAAPLPDTSNIIFDSRPGLFDLLDHLVTVHGRRRIAFIRGPAQNPEANERFEVYLDVLKKNNIAFDPNIVAQGDYSNYSATEAIKTLVDIRKASFDALASANDLMSLTALAQLQKRGYRVPEDVAVVGFDNVEATKLSAPPMSTVEQPIYEMGKRAVAMALAQIRGEKPSTVTIDSKALFRVSCGCRIFADIEENGELGKSIDEIPFHEIFFNRESDAIRQLLLPEASISVLIATVIEGADEAAIAQAYKAFDDIIREITLSEAEVSYLQGLLTRLRRLHYSVEGSNPQQAVWEDFFHYARIQLIETYQHENELQRKSQHENIKALRAVLNIMVTNMDDKEGSVQAIAHHLGTFGINTCFIGFYEKEFVYRKGQPWATPPVIKMALIYKDGEVEPIDRQNNAIRTCKFFNNDFIPQNRRFMLIANPLFFMEDQLGLILCEFNPAAASMYESLFMEMGCILKLSALIKGKEAIENKLRDAMRDLEDYNEELNNLSQTDELTGLYNRRGFLSLARQSLYLARKMKKNGLLFYADLDGLKKINDTYGHDEGDCALEQTALILKKVFRRTDIIARLGGDEYTAFTVDTSSKTTGNIQSRLTRLIGDYNKRSGKPYQISISMGAVPFFGKDDCSIEQLMVEADHLLYQQKRDKKLKISVSDR